MTAFAGLTIVFTTFPRSSFSQLEKRDLAELPDFSVDKLTKGHYTDSVSKWFSDTEPFRDKFLQLSMEIKNHLGLPKDENSVSFHAEAGSADPESAILDDDNREVGEYTNNVTRDEKAKVASRGIIIVGSGPNVRALQAYGGEATGGSRYAEAANTYKRTFGDRVNVYCMVIPTATAYYCPEQAKKLTKPQNLTINNIYSLLDPDVKAVDIYTPLGQHANEDIYLRTDHHWAPLGAFYAAQQFAKVAGVPFKSLDSYDRHVVHGYVGSMYGYSKDIAVKNAPEDFVYWTPRDIDYNTTYINYTVDKDYKVTAESSPRTGAFFFKYPDGSGGAYCTFMGGDTKIAQIRTGTKNGRRLIILKDSYGNALPGYLFYSFEEIHVIDNRYFTKNMKKYVEDNHITDILFANGIFRAYSPNICDVYTRFLNQNGAITPQNETDKPQEKKQDSNAKNAAGKGAEKNQKTAKQEKPKTNAEKPKKAENAAHATKKDDTPPAGKAPEAEKSVSSGRAHSSK